MHDLPLPPPWSQATDGLLGEATVTLVTGATIGPLLFAYADEEPVATVALRPFPPAGAPQALLEVLALLLPVGVDGVVLRLPGRAWPLDDPCWEDTEVDLRLPVLLVLRADGRDRPSRCDAALYALHRQDDGTPWWDPLAADVPSDDGLLGLLGGLLDVRAELGGHGDDDLRVPAQLSRVLLLGHAVALAPRLADEIERRTVAPPR